MSQLKTDLHDNSLKKRTQAFEPPLLYYSGQLSINVKS
jgi:hypothetical protein